MAKNTRTNKTAQFNMEAAAELDIADTATDMALLEGLLEDIVEDAPATESGDGFVDTMNALEAAETATPAEAADPLDEVLSELEIDEEALAAEIAAEVAAFDSAEDDQPEADKPTTEKKAKAPKTHVPRYSNSKKSVVLTHKLGEQAQDYLLLELDDASLDADGLKAKMDEVLAMIDTCGQKKVQEKAVMLFSWLKTGGKLNEVMARTFKVLVRDGVIHTGDKGNLHAELLSKPYSAGTARAQAGQMATMLPMLKIATKDGKGKLVANPDSLILMKAAAEFGL